MTILPRSLRRSTKITSLEFNFMEFIIRNCEFKEINLNANVAYNSQSEVFFWFRERTNDVRLSIMGDNVEYD